MKRRYKIILWILGGVLFLFLALFILITQTGFLEKQINLAIKAFLEKDYPVRITIGDISGNLLSGLSLADVKIEYVEKGSEYRLASLDTLNVEYQLSDLWNRRWILQRVVLVNPKFELHQTAEKGWLLPKSKSPKVIRRTGLFDFQIGEMVIKNSQFKIVSTRGDYRADSLYLTAEFLKNQKGWYFKIPSGSVIFPEQGLRVSDFLCEFLFTEEKLSLDTLSLATNWGKIALEGNLNLKPEVKYQLNVSTSGLDLESFTSLFRDVKLEGRADVVGEVKGDLNQIGGTALVNGNLFGRSFDRVRAEWNLKDKQVTLASLKGEVCGADLNGSAGFDLQSHPTEYRLRGRIGNLDLANILQSDLHSSFSGNMDLTGQGFNETDLRLLIDANLSSGYLDVYAFDSAVGEMEVDFNQIYFHPGFRARYKSTQGSFSGSLEYNGNIEISGSAQFDDLTEFYDKTFIREIAGRGKADLEISGLTEDFDVKGTFESDSIWIYKLYSSDLKGNLELKNFINHQKGPVNVDFRNGTAWDLPYDSLIGKLELDSLFVSIDTAYGGNQDLTVQMTGALDAAPAYKPLTFRSGTINYRGIAMDVGPQAGLIEISDSAYYFRDFRLRNGQGDLSISGELTIEMRMDLQLECRNLNIIPWAELYLPYREISGLFSSTVKLGGSFTNPRIKLDGALDSLKYGGFALGRLASTFTYQDSNLIVDSMTLTNSDWYFNLNGNIPINLSFDDTLGQRLVDRPQMINLSGRGKSFGVIPLFLPDIEYLRGDFTSSVQVSGTPFHPSLDGNIEMKNGEMKLDPVKDPLTKVVMNITMKDDRIYFQQVEAELEGKALIKKKKPWQKYLKDVLTFGYLFPDKVPKGKVAVTGEIQVKGFNDFLYDLKIKGINFPFLYEYMDVGGIANPELAITGETPPTVSGKINLTQLLYEEPFGSPVTLALAGRKPANPSSQWGWDFTIEAVDNIWVKNSDMNAEFAGEVQIYRVEGKLIMLGTLDALQGQFFVAGRSFDIEEGQIIFENTDDLDPSLNFLVTTQIYESSEAAGISASPAEQISLRITGTLSQPEIATAEGSKYTREQVLEMIVLQSQPGSTEGRSSPFQEKVIGGLGASVGSQLVQKFAYDLGVETFYIRPARGSGFDFSESEITLGGYLTRGLYWQYSSKFSSNPDVELQYRLNRNLFLEGNRDRDNLYHLGLNLRWEF